ncbi:MAG: phage tail protein [Pseudomonadota bacterium]|nr:phage tail protein [Pseudomonadota bacterium]
MHLMAYGTFVFSLATAAFNDLQRSSAWRHPATERIGARAARQFLGVGEETLTLNGVIAPPLTGDFASLDELRALADEGRPAALVDGAGRVYGSYVITALNETASLFFADGVPRRIEFSLSLVRVDDEDTAQAEGSP